MSIKSILLHIADDPRHGIRTRLAIQLAKRTNAHIHALYVTRPLRAAGAAGRAASVAFEESAREAAGKRLASAKAELEAACDSSGITHRWIETNEDHLDAMVRHTHIADIAIVSQTEPQHLEDHVFYQLPEKLIIAAGCPVLIVPRQGDAFDLEGAIVIAWRATREAVRAVRDSLTLMKSARHVTVLTVGKEPADSIQGDEIVEYLTLHDIPTERKTDFENNGESDIGRAILHHARDEKASFIVMGAFGHSRLRELVMGSVTREVLTHSTIPILVSH